MKLPGVLVLSYSLLLLPAAFGTHSPSANATGHCKSSPWIQGPMIGVPGRDGRDGPRGKDGLPGPPGPRGPSGIGIGEIREIVRLIAEEEVGNITTIVPQNPVNVVVNCADSSSGAVDTPTEMPFTEPPTTPTTEPPTGGMLTYDCVNASNQNCPGVTYFNPAPSCRDIHLCNRFLPSGYYWIRRYHSADGSFTLARVYCYMKVDKCGIAGVMRVGYLNITNTTTSCPQPLALYNASGKIFCESTNTDSSRCDQLTFRTYTVPYSSVCGRAVGYGYYYNYGFNYGSGSIDSTYLSGLSITNRNNGHRQHIWSYAVGYSDGTSNSRNCPCAQYAGRAPQSFVGSDYYCESGAHTSISRNWYTSNPLWDGKGCYSGSKCCNPSRAPWFWKFLNVDATTDIEVRLCQIGGSNDKTGIEQLEIYVY